MSFLIVLDSFLKKWDMSYHDVCLYQLLPPTNCVNGWPLSVNFVEVVEVSEIQSPKIWCFYQAGTYLLDLLRTGLSFWCTCFLCHAMLAKSHLHWLAWQPLLGSAQYSSAQLSSAQLSSAELSSAQPAPSPAVTEGSGGVTHLGHPYGLERGSGGMRWQWWYTLTERGVGKQELWYKATANQDSLFLVKIFQFFLSSAYFFSLIYNLILSTQVMPLSRGT